MSFFKMNFPALYKSGGVVLDVNVGNVLIMKKKHPCGSDKFLVLRIGADFRLRCLSCGREFMIARSKAEKNIKQITKT